MGYIRAIVIWIFPRGTKEKWKRNYLISCVFFPLHLWMHTQCPTVEELESCQELQCSHVPWECIVWVHIKEAHEERHLRQKGVEHSLVNLPEQHRQESPSQSLLCAKSVKGSVMSFESRTLSQTSLGITLLHSGGNNMATVFPQPVTISTAASGSCPADFFLKAVRFCLTVLRSA